MKLKKAKEYIDISKLSFKSKTIQIEIIKEWIKQAQLDAIEETVKLCAENARMGNTENGIYTVFEVSKQSILDCANILKKELE